MASSSMEGSSRGRSVTPPLLPSAPTPPPHTETSQESSKRKSYIVKEETSANVKSEDLKCKIPVKSESPKSPGSPNSASGEDVCSICLGTVNDRCVAGGCLHAFCLICLQEWAKQKAVCPLCKQPFDKIMYDIKSLDNYKEWKVPPKPPSGDTVREIYNRYREFFTRNNRRFYPYRTTRLSRLIRDLDRSLQAPQIVGEVGDALPIDRRQQRTNPFNFRGSSMFRLSVYLNDIWVLPLTDEMGRFRESSPELYTAQPALTHRLVPWVNRELAAIVPSSEIAIVLNLVMDLILEYPIDSAQFRNALVGHIGHRTRHFCHEFISFARSPYDMIGHDNAARYSPYFHDPVSSNDSDSDGVIEVDITGEPVDLTPRIVAREETVTNEGSVVISSSSESEVEPTTIFNRNSENSSINVNPEPPPTYKRPKRKTTPSVSHNQAGPSGLVYPSTSRNNPDIVCDDDDECEVLTIYPPKIERTPPVIQLDSDSGNDQPSTSRSTNSNSKVRLDRTSFAHFSQTLSTHEGSDQRDHSYCNADRISLSSSSTENSFGQTSTSFKRLSRKRNVISSDSSDDDDDRNPKNQRFRSPKAKPITTNCEVPQSNKSNKIPDRELDTPDLTSESEDNSSYLDSRRTDTDSYPSTSRGITVKRKYKEVLRHVYFNKKYSTYSSSEESDSKYNVKHSTENSRNKNTYYTTSESEEERVTHKTKCEYFSRKLMGKKYNINGSKNEERGSSSSKRRTISPRRRVKKVNSPNRKHSKKYKDTSDSESSSWSSDSSSIERHSKRYKSKNSEKKKKPKHKKKSKKKTKSKKNRYESVHTKVKVKKHYKKVCNSSGTD